MSVKRAAMAAVNAPSAVPIATPSAAENAENAASVQPSAPTSAAVQTARQPWASLPIRKPCRTPPHWPLARAASWMQRPPLAKPKAQRLAMRHAHHANAAAATAMAVTAVSGANAKAMEKMAMQPCMLMHQHRILRQSMPVLPK